MSNQDLLIMLNLFTLICNAITFYFLLKTRRILNRLFYGDRGLTRQEFEYWIEKSEKEIALSSDLSWIDKTALLRMKARDR